ncbi:hypothetical protein TNCV_2858501 [Trichonephila clavipes]|nr:hypothetical protein TNCV_2858501 [Trichonephila clavipes]
MASGGSRDHRYQPSSQLPEKRFVVCGNGAELRADEWRMLCLGYQSLPSTDLGRVDEEMASPSGSYHKL